MDDLFKQYISDINTENVIKLANHLRNRVPSDKFHMGVYNGEFNDAGEAYEWRFQDYDNCGTVACALGHLPFVKEIEDINESVLKCFIRDNGYREDAYLSFEKLCVEVLGVHTVFSRRAKYGVSSSLELSHGGSCIGGIWDFCFSTMWRHKNNTAKGAAERLRFIVNLVKKEDYKSLWSIHLSGAQSDLAEQFYITEALYEE